MQYISPSYVAKLVSRALLTIPISSLSVVVVFVVQQLSLPFVTLLL